MVNVSINLIVTIEDTEDFLRASDVIYDMLKVDENGLPKNLSFVCPYAVLSCYTRFWDLTLYSLGLINIF